ncbi:MAG TPA: hypothetical protein VKB93_11710 [Thermoanaerobaculia bacterium]|nr:hypothetical protein [Thermoanaerobaculia bacterium]
MPARPLSPLFKLSPGAARVTHSLPDGVLALLFALAAAGEIPVQRRIDLYFVMFVEAGFLILQLALVDTATRLKKALPTDTIIAIVVGLTFFLGLPLEVLRWAWSMGLYVFVSLVLSLVERGAILRRMPERPPIEKIAARALISNRIVTALTLIGAFFAAIIIVVALTPREWPDESWPQLAAGAMYFAIAAFDDWRVRGRRFADNPRTLFGYELLNIRQLDPR